MGLRKYPIYNPVAYACITCLDAILKLILPQKKTTPPAPCKLLICNRAHLGDVILTTSLLPAIKQAYPNIKIGMAVGSWSLPVIQNHPLVDQVHVIDQTRRGALKEIIAFDYDTAIDCGFHYPNLALLLWQARIPIRIGFESAGLSPFLTHKFPWQARANASAVHAYFSLLADFPEINSASLRPTLPLSPKKEVDPYIVIHMGSRNAQKEWPLEKWIELTQRLQGYHLYFTGKGKKEFAHIEAIRAHFPKVKNLCDTLSWPEFIGTIQNAKLLIGIDTSAGHVAAATQTPAVLLFTSIHPPNLWRPFYKEIHVITKSLPCHTCLKGCRSMSCIKEISVERVFEKVEKVFSSV